MSSKGRALLGSQSPTHRHYPPCKRSRADDVFLMADLVGIELDPWQRQFITDMLGIREDGKWAAFETVIELARQNGKSVVLDLVALTALYIWRLPTIVYSAHEGTTAMKAFERLELMVKNTPALRKETPDRCIKRANGKEKIKLLSGPEILFKTRTAGGGRGLSGDLVIMDEAQALNDSHVAALFPTLRARPNPLIIYAGSAGDQKSTVLGRLVRRIDRKDERLCGWRFAGNEDDDPADPKTWAKVTPALGRRVDVDYMAAEQRSLAADKFARELLCIGDYPREDGEDWVIPSSAVDETTSTRSTSIGPVVFAADAKPDQSWAAIAAAGQAGIMVDPEGLDHTKGATARPGGGIHAEVVAHQRGVRWLPSRVHDLMAEHANAGVLVIDPKGPLGRMVPEFEDLGIKVHLISGPQEVADGCGWLFDNMVNDPRGFWHRGAAVFVSAIASAAVRSLSGGFAWRRTGSADISPLCAVTFAAHAAATWATKPPTPPPSPVSARRGTARHERPQRRRRTRGDFDVATVQF